VAAVTSSGLWSCRRQRAIWRSSTSRGRGPSSRRVGRSARDQRGRRHARGVDGRADRRVGRSARDQRGGGELVKGRPGGGRVAVPSGSGVEAQTCLTPDACEPVLDVPCGRGPRVIGCQEQRPVTAGIGSAARERLSGHERPERRLDSVTAREAGIDSSYRRERHPLRSGPRSRGSRTRARRPQRGVALGSASVKPTGTTTRRSAAPRGSDSPTTKSPPPREVTHGHRPRRPDPRRDQHDHSRPAETREATAERARSTRGTTRRQTRQRCGRAVTLTSRYPSTARVRSSGRSRWSYSQSVRSQLSSRSGARSMMLRCTPAAFRSRAIPRGRLAPSPVVIHHHRHPAADEQLRRLGLSGVIARHRDRRQPTCERALIMSGGPSTRTTHSGARRRDAEPPNRSPGHRQHLPRTVVTWGRSATRRGRPRERSRIGMTSRPCSHPHASSSTTVARDHNRRCSVRSTNSGHRCAASRSRAMASSAWLTASTASSMLCGSCARAAGREVLGRALGTTTAHGCFALCSFADCVEDPARPSPVWRRHGGASYRGTSGRGAIHRSAQLRTWTVPPISTGGCSTHRRDEQKA
jgi:hypothetical protein